jgi:hypothetical protein
MELFALLSVQRVIVLKTTIFKFLKFKYLVYKKYIKTFRTRNDVVVVVVVVVVYQTSSCKK